MRRPLDAELVRRGLIGSRTEAAEVVRQGRVMVAGRHAGKPSTLVASDEAIEVTEGGRPFVSRGGEKLDAAMDRFGVDPAGRRCLDAGSSTGGFTDCLLRRGAAHVVSVDVGYGQLAWGLRQDPRVIVLERTNVRELWAENLPYEPELVTADLSFISLRLAIPALSSVASADANFVLLVKPQFEAEKRDVGKGGVVRDPDVWVRVLGRVVETCRASGLGPLGAAVSPLLGPAGNVEFFLHAQAGRPGAPVDLDEVAREGEALRTAS